MSQVRNEVELAMLATLEADRERFVQESVVAIATAIPKYSVRPDPAFVEEIAEFLRANLDLFVATAKEGRDPTEEELEMVRITARRRLEQGIPLVEILRAFRVGHRVFMEGMMEERRKREPEAEVPLGLSLDGLRYIDAASLELASTYVLAEKQMQADSDHHRSLLVGTLIEGGWPADQHRQALAHELPVTADMRYLVLVGRSSDELPSEDQRLAGRLRGATPPFLGGTSVSRSGETITVLAIGDTPGDEAARLATSALRNKGAGSSLAVGVGCVAHGSLEIAVAYREASTAARSAAPGTDVSLPELSLVERLVVLMPGGSDPRRLVNPELRRFLKHDAAGAGEMTATVRAYVDCGFSARRAAEQLFVHPNTVLYRLNRTGERLSIDLQSAPEAIDFAIASRLLEPGDDRRPGEG